MTGLALTGIRGQIAEAKNTDEIADIRDKARAMKAYAKTRREATESIADLEEIIARCDFRLAELQAPKKKAGPGRGKKSDSGVTLLSDGEKKHRQRLRDFKEAVDGQGGIDAVLAKRRAEGKKNTRSAIVDDWKANASSDDTSARLAQAQVFPIPNRLGADVYRLRSTLASICDDPKFEQQMDDPGNTEATRDSLAEALTGLAQDAVRVANRLRKAASKLKVVE